MSRDGPLDALGRIHPAVESDARIVSLVPSITELLFDLRLESQIVGRTTFCIHPAKQVSRVPRVGGTKKVRMDKLRTLAPSHVIVNVDENRKEDVDTIGEFVPHVIVTHPQGPEDNLDLYRLLGHVFHRQDEAEHLCEAFEKSRQSLREAALGFPQRRVLYLIWREPWMSISRDTYISRVLALANWQTACDDPKTRYPEITVDENLLDDIDMVLFSSEPFPFKPKHLQEFRELTGDTRTPLEFIDGEMTSWYGSRAIEGLRYLRELAGRLP